MGDLYSPNIFKKSLLLYGVLNLGEEGSIQASWQFWSLRIICSVHKILLLFVKPNAFSQSIPPTILPMLADIMQDKSSIELLSMIQETWGRRRGEEKEQSKALKPLTKKVLWLVHKTIIGLREALSVQ